MPLHHDTHCLFSTIRNVSGGRLIAGFLPPHGRELADNEEFTVFGNILEAVAQMRGDRVSSRRDIQAFEAAINDGSIIIVHTPNPIVQDDSTGVIQMVRLHQGTLGVTDPCWHHAGSIVDDDFGGSDFTG